MAISKAEKAAYNDEVKGYKREVDDINHIIRDLTLKKKKFPTIENYYTLEIVYHQLRAINYFMHMSSLSLQMLGIKNDTFLNNARKGFYKVLQDMEELVGKDIDRSLKENDDFLSKIERLTPADIFRFVQLLHTVLKNLIDSIGEGSKWKWTFVELQARVAVITKNITSFSEIAKYRDPRSEFYKERQNLLQLCKDDLTEAAKQYRTKYELSGKARDDLKASIEFLSALRRIHVIFSESEEANKLKNTIDAARQTLDAEDKSKDEKKKKQA